MKINLNDVIKNRSKHSQGGLGIAMDVDLFFLSEFEIMLMKTIYALEVKVRMVLTSKDQYLEHCYMLIYICDIY